MKYEVVMADGSRKSGDADEVYPWLGRNEETYHGKARTIYEIHADGTRRTTSRDALRHASAEEGNKKFHEYEQRERTKGLHQTKTGPMAGLYKVGPGHYTNPKSTGTLKVAAVVGVIAAVIVIPLYLSGRLKIPAVPPVTKSGLTINDPALAALANLG